jgi:hypothetical protein
MKYVHDGGRETGLKVDDCTDLSLSSAEHKFEALCLYSARGKKDEVVGGIQALVSARP